MLLNNDDFLITELDPSKPFAYQPFRMRTKFDFIEGYIGNGTIREWRKFDSIYHAVFACMRGMPGYPKGEASEVIPEGLLLRPAVPGPVVGSIPHTYGPMANFKIAVRELPDQGNFRVTIRASRYDDGLLLSPGTDAINDQTRTPVVIEKLDRSSEATVAIAEDGVYQIDVSRVPGENKGVLSLQVDDRHFTGALPEYRKSPSDDPAGELAQGFLVVRLAAGEHRIVSRLGDNTTLRRLIFTRLDERGELGRRFAAFEGRNPWLGVHVGLRRDCGSTLAGSGEPADRRSRELHDFVFRGRDQRFPSPTWKRTTSTIWPASARSASVANTPTAATCPRLLIRSVEFEGPYYDEWPPTTHRNIFIDSEHKIDPAVYASEIIRSFATRAFRRPVSPGRSDLP